MNQRKAFKETVTLAIAKGMPRGLTGSTGLEHLIEMEKVVVNGDFSDAKLGRWLGWAQACLVVADVGVTLEDVKEINRRNA